MVLSVAGSMLNHSCVPSCAVVFGDEAAKGGEWTGWGRVSLLALRDLAPESELAISRPPPPTPPLHSRLL